MVVTKQQVAVQLLNYLQSNITLKNLVSWAEDAIMESNIQDEDTQLIIDILGKLGLGDVKEFGLYWDDCVDMMKKLGYDLRIHAGLVA